MTRHKLLPAVAAGAALTLAAGTTVSADGAPRATAAVAQSSSGGFATTPSILETTARSGASGSVTVSNSTGRKLRVTVRARPWSQARSGRVAANRNKRLSGVRVSSSSFTLGSGSKRAIRVSLSRVPSSGSLFGALEIVGRPTKKQRGINVVYRLIPSLRFHPGSKRVNMSAHGVKVVGGQVVLPVRNRGNTIDPVSGSVSISGGGVGRSGGIPSTRILPGKTVNLPLTSRSGLRAGSYRASITLRQGGKTRRISRSFKIG